MVNREVLVERFFEILINGDRPSARALVQEQLKAGMTPAALLTDVFWPTYELLDRLFREDQLTNMSHHLSTRLLRVLADQVASRLAIEPSRNRTIFMACGPAEGDELGAQIASDLIESKGYTVTFAGGGIPADEIQAQVHEFRPDVLVLFASAPSDLPGIRSLIDNLNEIGACRGTRIVVGGGVFNRAEGLADAIGAHHFAANPLELVEVVCDETMPRLSREERPVARTGRSRARDAA